MRPFINILLDLLTAPGLSVTEYHGIFALGSWRQCIWMGKATGNMDANSKLLVSIPEALKEDKSQGNRENSMTVLLVLTEGIDLKTLFIVLAVCSFAK